MNDLISRQEALDWLKNEWNGMVTSLFDGIKALPSAQPEKTQHSEEDATSDCISRRAAIDALVNHSYPVRYDYGFTSIENGMTVTGIRQALSELPSAEPERKTGRWIKVGYIENTYLVSKCSVCGYQTIDAGNYCTNCGAYMYNTVEIARDIVHQAIDNTVWLDTVDIAKMHKAVDDKYVEMEVEHE